MWHDEEDNNPYGGSFDHQDSTAPNHSHIGSPGDFGFHRPTTPPSPSSPTRDESPEFVSSQPAMSDIDYDDDDDDRGGRAQPKKEAYNSRIEQILYENPDMEILIIAAGKNLEGGGGYIAYTIRTGDIEVRRRYSEFASLREALVQLHPTLIIPPIPEKHSMADYAAKPTKAKEDQGIIDLRKRMLAVFLNRCRRMKEVREDGVWWRFLDPNASWNEVLHSPPLSTIPKQVLKAPPLNTANPTAAHAYLPVPSSSAKLKTNSTAFSGTPTSPQGYSTAPSSAAHTIPGPQVFGRFPPSSHDLSEAQLDPYFVNFEASSKELEMLLQGSMEKVNRRLLNHLHNWSTDLMELGARLNGFSLSEQDQSLSAAIERTGQAVDSTYVATSDLSTNLSATFAEPMRESAQFAGVVRNVLRYRVLKRVQEEMTKDELEKKKGLLSQLETSEQEAQRIEQYLNHSGISSPSAPRRSLSSGSNRSSYDRQRNRESEETASIDSDFPPTHGDGPSPPSASQGQPQSDPASPTHRRGTSTSSFTNRLFSRVSHTFQGMMDVDPERTRRDQIGKTKESLQQLESALQVAENDVKEASSGVLKDLKRFQAEKEEDLKRYMVAFARCHIDWARKNQVAWEEAKAEVANIQARSAESE